MESAERTWGRRRTVVLVGVVVALVSAIALIALLAAPLSTTVDYTLGTLGETGIVEEPTSAEIDCGSPLRGGPRTYSDRGFFVDRPCEDAIRTRRALAVGVGIVFVLAAATVLIAGRRNPDDPQVDRL
ncbi:MAG TPA: hypothetical protein VIY72_03300 [Acidimicrobiales bacterium]